MQSSKKPKMDHPRLVPIIADEYHQDIPLVEVYVSKIKNPKTTSKVVVDLNSILPIPELTHLKRVKGNEVLLYPKDDNNILEILNEKGFNMDLIEDVRIVSVAKIPPKTRLQYNTVHKLWPCNFHSNAYLEKLCTNTVFSDLELEKHKNFMRVTLEICELAGTQNSALVVDPTIDSIVAFGFEQCEKYPTKHSAMVAIDEVARTQNGGVWHQNEKYQEIENFLKNRLKFGFGTTADGPYLCTGYTVYLVVEPCVTCAMALVHSRVKRVFYGVRSRKGGLGSLCKIHVLENLNHHFEVFAGLLRDECEIVGQQMK